MTGPAGKAVDVGPFQDEMQAINTPAVQGVYAAFDRAPGAGRMAPHNKGILIDAIAAAGVTLGDFDRRIVSWLAGWEPTTVVVIAGLIRRAADGPDVPPEQGEDADHTPHLVLARIDQLANSTRTESGPEPGGSAHITAPDLATVLDALDRAATEARDRAADCDDNCGAMPGRCQHLACEYQLARADGYDAIAAKLGGAR